MPELIIADTSCLILLDKIGQLEILHQVYGEVFITPAVLKEYGQPAPGWVKVKSPVNDSTTNTIAQLLNLGEASSIALALENPTSIVIIDDLKARKMARKLALRVTGTLGVLMKAKETGVIKKLKPFIKELEKTDFRIAQKIIDEILKIVGE